MAFDGTLKFDTAIDQSGFKSGLAGLGSIAKTGMAAVGAAVTAAAGTMAVLGKSALDAYADYEQLTGGVSTLFGAQEMSLNEYAASVGKSVDAAEAEYNRLILAQTDVMNNAAKAFRTAGMSQNEYMETVTSFSAALISSLGGDTLKAAEVADRAIVDMADNVNKMGSSMESIQNAYQGFAKQNYTMLDNLKLGYGGTKSEMERLLADAEAISGVHYDISSYADVVEAIHVIQTEMGITGTTAKEASETISGSLASLGAAWSNVLVGIADDEQDFDKLIDDLVESAATAADNILPRVETIISGISSLISSMSGVLTEAVIGLMEYIPEFINAGVDVVNALADSLTESAPMLAEVASNIAVQLTGAFAEMAPKLIAAGITIITSLAQSIAGNIGPLVDSVTDGIALMASALTENIEPLLDAALEIVRALAESLIRNMPMLLDAALTVVKVLAQAILDDIPLLIEVLIQLVGAIAAFLIDNYPVLIEAATELFMAIVEALPLIIEALVEQLPTIISAVITTLVSAAPQLAEASLTLLLEIVKAIPQVIAELVNGLSELWNSVSEWWSETTSNAISAIAEWLKTMLDDAVQGAVDIVTGVMEFLDELPGKIGEMLGTALGNIVKWCSEAPEKARDAASRFLENIKSFFTKLPGNVKDYLDKTISKVVDWAKSLKDKAKSAASGMVENITDTIKDLPSDMLEAGKNLVKGLWDGITGMGSWLKDKISDFGSGIIDGFKSAFGIASPSKVMRDSVGRYLAQGIGVGFTEEIPDVGREAVKAMQELTVDIGDIEPDGRRPRPRSPGYSDTALSALSSQSSLLNSSFAQPSATSEVISNSYTYNNTTNNGSAHGAAESIVLNAQFVVGKEVVAEGVRNILVDEVDKRQGVEVKLKQRGLAR